jgi:hypothetical protein
MYEHMHICMYELVAKPGENSSDCQSGWKIISCRYQMQIAFFGLEAEN